MMAETIDSAIRAGSRHGSIQMLLTSVPAGVPKGGLVTRL